MTIRTAYILTAVAACFALALYLNGFSQRYNVVIFAFDGLNAKHLSAYGYATATAPALGQFFNESYVFADMVRTASSSDVTGSDLLVSGTTTLATLLYEHGYTTAAFTGGGAHVDREVVRAGFEEYYVPELIGNYAGSVPRALEWVARRPRAKAPFFLLVHGNDLARIVPEPQVGALITRTDLEFATFMRGLNTQGLLETTVIIVASYDGTALVPLAARAPEVVHKRIETPLKGSAIVPAVFQLLDVQSTSTYLRSEHRIL